MKPGTIYTDQGIFELDHDGFYVPYVEPEKKYWWSGYLLYALAGVGIGIAALVVWWVWG